jgi:bacteriocin biosynthesis cyclodehydratase domain-containing protein
MTTYALRETVEAFPAGDGAIYFLRGGTHAEHVLETPTDLDRRMLELLHAPRTREELLASAGDGAGDGTELDELLAALDTLDLLDTDTGGAATAGLPGEALERYGRQLPYLGVDGQRRLLEATVTLVGCGALGTWTALALACAGIGRLVLVDDDVVELGNLNRQVLFRHGDIGRAKVEAAAEALRAYDPRLEVVGLHRRVASAADVAEVIAGADLVVATADDPPYAIDRWVNAAALEHGIPHVAASLLPPFVRVGPLVRPGVTGCVECQHLAARREHPDHDALVAYREAHHRASPALGSLSALIGSVLSTDAIHLLTGAATPATEGHAVMIDSRDLTVTKEPVLRESGCALCAGAAIPAAA